MTQTKANQEAKLYGLRYLSAFISEISHTGEKEPGCINQMLLLAQMAQVGDKRRSQLGQDVFALAMNGFSNGRYFVEVGANHSESLSNTHMLEKEFGWSGLLLEPDPANHANLTSERSAELIKKAAWNKSGETLTFSAVADNALSSIATLDHNDAHDRSNASEITVTTITLDDALDAAGAPETIDYVSIDVEGAELQVLEGMDLSRRNFTCFTIEFNHDAERLAGYDAKFLAAGYERVMEIVSDFDAWYVKKDVYDVWRSSIVFPGA